MYHPFFVDEAWATLTASSWTRDACVQGVGSASIIMLRDIEHRMDNGIEVDVDGEHVDLAFGRTHMTFPLDFAFDPFPFTARDLLPYRVRTAGAMKTLCVAVVEAFKEAGISWLPWLGFMRFWGEVGHQVFRDAAVNVAVDILVPLESVEELLRWGSGLPAQRERDPTRGLYMYEVYPNRLLQISLNWLPELGDGIDVQRVCPTCAVLNVYFISSEGTLMSHAPPCAVNDAERARLERYRDAGLWTQPDAGLMPEGILELLWKYGGSYFAPGMQMPCNVTLSSWEPVADMARLGTVSAALVAPVTPVDAGLEDWLTYSFGTTGHANLGGHEGGHKAEDPQPAILPATNFAEGLGSLLGAAGWFAYMEMRMSAQRPGLALFQTKLHMKKLMTERGVPIPRLFHGSMTSPKLPFGPPLPTWPGGYVVKPAHLAESAHVFVIAEDGVNLLTGHRPTFEEVQGNITEAWDRSLLDYDGARQGGQACARSKRYAKYLENRSCANWALYRSPPGVIVEELVRPSQSYDALQHTAFRDQGLGITWRQQPDEMKCHVVWGKLFVAEWVSSGVFLGFIFRHGFVKDNIVFGPRTLHRCWGRAVPEGQACDFNKLWKLVVGIAERAVPIGVDYLRVDVFPNWDEPVVNELSVAGYSTMMEDWMLDEMMHRVREGYVWRGVHLDNGPA